MTSSRNDLFRVTAIFAALALAIALAGCKEGKDPGYQGWVEADMIFVSPDESGRVTKLSVREGDEVKPGAPLYEVDDDLQKADLNQHNATLANAQQTYDRAASLSQDRLRHAGQFRLRGVGAAGGGGAGQYLANAAGAAQRLCAGRRHRSADLFPRGRDGAGAAAGAVDHAARQHEAALLRAGDAICRSSRSATRSASPATIAPPISPQKSTSSRHRPNTPRR